MKRASKPSSRSKSARPDAGERPKRRTFSWTQLYEARYVRQPPEPLPAISPGRPPRSLPVKKTSVTYTAGDEETLQVWQERFTALLGRKPSMGETAGLLARICSNRLEALDLPDQPASLNDLVDLMVGPGPEAAAE